MIAGTNPTAGPRAARAGRGGVLAGLMLCVIAPVAFAQPVAAQHATAPDDARSRFAEACRVYESAIDDADRGDEESAREGFRLAASGFESLARDHGLWNEIVWADAGLAHASAGDPGRAVLAYRRAAMLAPWRADIRRGLDHARELVRVGIEPEGAWKVIDVARALALRVPQRGALLLGLGAYAAGFVLLGLTLCGRVRARAGAASTTKGARESVRPGWRVPRWIAPACMGIGVVGVAMAAGAAELARSDDGVVVATRVTARQGPSELVHPPAFDEPLSAGVEVRVLEARRGWLRVRLRDGRECWTPEGAVERVTPAARPDPIESARAPA